MAKIPDTFRRLATVGRLFVSGQTSEAFYLIRNHLKGLDLRHVSVADLGLSASRSEHYASSGGPQLARVLKKLGVPSGSRALDLGCGKGGAIFTMAGFPFLEVVGVELSAELVRIAQANASRLQIPAHVSFVCSDAALFTDYDRFTHLYMYNPFPSVVVRDVMKEVAGSLARAPRQLVLIYKNPVCHDDIVASRILTMQNEFKCGPGLNNTFRVYVHEP